ncbi:reverse transcriptase domain-containing protein [Alkalicoccobacillus gibsonii]|uniref:reverse transcriptase domain-containing protein n=1 Tax=Alkalicoccobacillus gibsonii TaxID=79881 RepID=UPI0035177EDA
MLEIPKEFLWKILIKNKLNNYRIIVLKKKDGTDRIIHAPSKNLLILQRKLAYILNLKVKIHRRAHGFEKNRSIITNAREHLNQKFVLNFDLKNFFNNVTSPRVFSLFHKYFKLNQTVAGTLTNICCHPEKFLPQGGATSPIITNILAKGLDKQISELVLATSGRNYYTRYADDITISSNQNEFPGVFAKYNNGSVQLSNEIENIIKRQGFKVNERKTRIRNKNQNQTVTGIVVNEKLNVNRIYIRRIRSILNCIEKNQANINEAKEIFYSKYEFRQRISNKPDMFDVLKGMIIHVGNVKGSDDPVYLKLARRFNKIAKGYISPFNVPRIIEQIRDEYTFVISSHDDYCTMYKIKDKEGFVEIKGQGTGFLLEGIGIITNYHVLKEVLDVLNENSNVELMEGIPIRTVNATEYRAHPLYWDKAMDIAILSVDNLSIQGYKYHLNDDELKIGTYVTLLGFPEYRQGQPLKTLSSEIISYRRSEQFLRIEIRDFIYKGNSGGPILNDKNEVVGVAVKGTDFPSECIPISQVIELYNRNKS